MMTAIYLQDMLSLSAEIWKRGCMTPSLRVSYIVNGQTALFVFLTGKALIMAKEKKKQIVIIKAICFFLKYRYFRMDAFIYK